MGSSSLYARVGSYYADKLREHGPTARGVDWNGEASQHVRFAQLYRLLGEDRSASVLDLGCGYGGFLLYLREQGHVGEYYGMDLSPEMVAATRAYGQGDLLATFEVGALPSQPADFVVSSGIFSVRVDVSDEEWEAHMADTVRAMAAACRHGFGFNCLTNRRDFSQEHLYYADPDAWSGFCARSYVSS